MNKRLEKVVNAIATLQNTIGKVQFDDCDNEQRQRLQDYKESIDEMHKQLTSEAMGDIIRTKLEGQTTTSNKIFLNGTAPGGTPRTGIAQEARRLHQEAGKSKASAIVEAMQKGHK